MSVILIPPEVLRVGDTTPFALRDKSGCLLVPRGTLLSSPEQLQHLVARELYVHENDHELLQRALTGKLDAMMRGNALLGALATAVPDAADVHAAKGPPPRPVDPTTTLSDLQLRTSALLRDAAQPDFEARLLRVQASLTEFVDADADVALFLLVHAATHQLHDYNVRHAMLVSAVCDLAARQMPSCSDASRRSLGCAALTMNIAMTQLHNQLAMQDSPPSAAQRARIAPHAAAGAAALRAAGVGDEDWLGAVERHHDTVCGALESLPPADRLARLIRRADIFAARLSPRKCRPAMSSAAAAQAIYFDENQQPDPAGSAIIKAVGLYPPGSLVRLRSGEVAVALRRGWRATQPAAASILNSAGLPIAEPARRDTRLRAYEVTAGVPPHEVKVHLNLERLLKMM